MYLAPPKDMIWSMSCGNHRNLIFIIKKPYSLPWATMVKSLKRTTQILIAIIQSTFIIIPWWIRDHPGYGLDNERRCSLNHRMGNRGIRYVCARFIKKNGPAIKVPTVWPKGKTFDFCSKYSKYSNTSIKVGQFKKKFQKNTFSLNQIQSWVWLWLIANCLVLGH